MPQIPSKEDCPKYGKSSFVLAFVSRHYFPFTKYRLRQLEFPYIFVGSTKYYEMSAICAWAENLTNPETTNASLAETGEANCQVFVFLAAQQK